MTNRRVPKRPSLPLAVALLAATALLAGACGFLSDDDDAATTTTGPSDTTAATIVPPVVTTATTGDGTDGTGDGTGDGTTDTTTSEGPQITVDSKLSTQGLGPVHIGHSREDAEAAAGAAFTLASEVSDSCSIYLLDDGPEALTFTLVDDEVHRIDVNAPGITTISGYGLGSTKAEIEAAFPNRIEDGPVADAIQYVPVDEPDADKRVVWALNPNDEVMRMWTGRLPYVNEIAPCFSEAG